jgi:hypothetical protein
VSAPPPLDAVALLRALAEHDVEFVVIGGFSLAAHGVVRGTKDLDIVPAPARENLERLTSVLRAVDATPAAPDEGFRPEELPYELDADGLAAGGNWLLHTRHGRLDVMQDVLGASYDRLRAAAVAYRVAGEGPYLFAGLDDLIAMKRATGRPQDMIDVASLAQARRPDYN